MRNGAEIRSDAIDELQTLAMQAIRELESPDGILASGRGEAYGCVFGRDSLIVALELLRACAQGSAHRAYYLELVEKILRSLASLQGRHVTIESGEEPGKIVHEYRPEKHEHLTQLLENPWFLYPEGVMRNYDSVDSTPLFLIAVSEFERAGGGRAAVEQLMPAVRAALRWLEQFPEFITYQFHPERRYGGLVTQSWMDSAESLFFEEDDERPRYPIAPVEAQAYAWSAFKRWGREERAAQLKAAFNKKFVLRGPRSVTLAFAFDGTGRPLTAPRSSMGHVLWAAIPAPFSRELFASECILNAEDVPALRKRLLARDLFVPKAGVRTLSNRSRHFEAHSYHNGSIWPHDTAMLADGLENFGYAEDARRVRAALLNAYLHFKTPIELFAYERGIKEYQSGTGHRACRVQAWSAAALLSILPNAAEDAAR